eukprot:6185381-Pleurochrysis_carterae.AAC.4
MKSRRSVFTSHAVRPRLQHQQVINPAQPNKYSRSDAAVMKLLSLSAYVAQILWRTGAHRLWQIYGRCSFKILISNDDIEAKSKLMTHLLRRGVWRARFAPFESTLRI